MARWLDDLIGKVFAVKGEDQVQVGRIDFKEGAGAALTPQIVEGAEGEPTTLELTIAGGAGGSSLLTQVGATGATGSIGETSVEKIHFQEGSGIDLAGNVDPGDPVTLELTISGGPTGSTTTSSIAAGGTGDRNDYVPGGVDDDWDAASVWEASAGTVLTVTGFEAPTSLGPHFRAIQVPNGTAVTLTDEDASSVAWNRMRTPNGESSVTIRSGTWGMWYDDTISRWRILGAFDAGYDGEPNVVSVATSSDQDSWQPGGAGDWDQCRVLLINSNAPIDISGFQAPLGPSSPHIKYVFKASSNPANVINFSHEDGATGTAAWRLRTKNNADDVMRWPNEMRVLIYDPFSSRWRLEGGPNPTVFGTVAEMRAGVPSPLDGVVYRTLGQDEPGDGYGGDWLGVSGGAGAFTHDGLMCVVPSGGDGSLGMFRTSGPFFVAGINDDDIASWQMPANAAATGGFASVVGSPGTFPSGANSGMLYYDAGNSPAVAEVYAGSNFDISTAGVPTGTTGVDGNATVFVQDEAMYIENRTGVTGKTFKVNMFI